MKKQIEKILGEQLELLAEASRKKSTTQKELSDLSMAIAAISAELRAITVAACFSLDFVNRPDKYELRSVAEGPAQEHKTNREDWRKR